MHPAPILYWFPGTLTVPPAHQHLFRRDGRPRINQSRNTCGPVSNQRGLLATPCANVTLGYSPGTQRWDKLAADIWIGASVHAEPELFQRAKTYPGIPVTLGNGKTWNIPVANPYATTCSLPVWERLVPGNRWEPVVHDQYLELSQRAAELAAQFRARIMDPAAAITIPDAELRQLIADALAVNYDIRIEELSALRVFGPEIYQPAVEAIIDLAAIQSDLLAAAKEAAADAPFGDSDPADTHNI